MTDGLACAKRILSRRRSCRPRAKRLRADLVERGIHGDRLRIDLEPYQRWTVLGERAFQRGRELLRAVYGLGVRAISPCEHGKVWIDEIGTVDAGGKVSFLMHADRAIAAVVDHDENDLEGILHRGCQLLAVHEKASVSVP